jgi:hypothetical protein
MRYPLTVPPGDPALATPLSAWIGALVITAFVGLSAWTIAIEAGAPPATPFVEFNQARVNALRSQTQTQTQDAVTVVMLGSSALKYATRQEFAFADAISSKIMRPVHVLRIASNWGTFNDYIPLAHDLAALRPDLVVLEQQLLATDRPRMRSFLLWIEKARLKLGVAPPLESSAEDEAHVQFEYPCWKRGFGRGMADHVRERDEWVALRPDGPAAAAAGQFVEDLLAAGAEVALVDIPRRSDYDSDARQLRDATTSGARFEALQDRVQHWEHGPLDAGLYCDLTHVTPAGQAVISNWLESKVADALAQPSA